MKKVIVVGIWHRDQNQINVINEVLPLLKSNHWVVGCEFDSKETVDDQIVSAKASMQKSENELSHLLLEANAKIDLQTLQTVSEDGLKECDREFYDTLHTAEKKTIRHIAIMHLTNCNSKAISIEVYLTLKQSSCSIRGLDSKSHMDLESHLQNLIFFARKNRNDEELERLENLLINCMNERDSKIVNNSVAITDELNSNNIVFIGAGHLVNIKGLLEKREDIESSFYYLVPEQFRTALGQSDAQHYVDDTELNKLRQHDIVGITLETIGLLNDQISAAEQSMQVKM